MTDPHTTPDRAAIGLHVVEDAYFNGRKEAVIDADHEIRKLFASSVGREHRDSYNAGVRDALWRLASILPKDRRA
jgi:hypothetical protein